MGVLGIRGIHYLDALNTMKTTFSKDQFSNGKELFLKTVRFVFILEPRFLQLFASQTFEKTEEDQHNPISQNAVGFPLRLS